VDKLYAKKNLEREKLSYSKQLIERHFSYSRQRIENRHYGWRLWSVKSLRYSSKNFNCRRNNGSC